MFVHRGKLDPALSAADYVDAEVFAQERERIFAQHWHLVGAQGVLAKPGGQVTCELEGRPVVVRNESGTLVAFRNVCPHRHSLIVREGESVAESLRCQYHGWQFRADGRLAQLPDGPSFRGFKARDACLESYAVESLGPLVFVRLSRSGPSLREAFGAVYDELARSFAGLGLAIRQQTLHDANWKIPVENAVESYHVPLIHPTSFKNYLAEELHEHELEPTYSRYRPIAPPSLRERAAFQAFAWMHERDRSQRYQHLHVFPNYLVTYSGIYVEIVEIVPLSAERCGRNGYGFLPSDVRRNPLARGLDLAHRLALKRAAESILREDSSVWPSVQRGSRHSLHRGVLGAREERVFHFQRYIAHKLGRSTR